METLGVKTVVGPAPGSPPLYPLPCISCKIDGPVGAFTGRKRPRGEKTKISPAGAVTVGIGTGIHVFTGGSLFTPAEGIDSIADLGIIVVSIVIDRVAGSLAGDLPLSDSTQTLSGATAGIHGILKRDIHPGHDIGTRQGCGRGGARRPERRIGARRFIPVDAVGRLHIDHPQRTGAGEAFIHQPVTVVVDAVADLNASSRRSTAVLTAIGRRAVEVLAQRITQAHGADPFNAEALGIVKGTALTKGATTLGSAFFYPLVNLTVTVVVAQITDLHSPLSGLAHG